MSEEKAVEDINDGYGILDDKIFLCCVGRGARTGVLRKALEHVRKTTSLTEEELIKMKEKSMFITQELEMDSVFQSLAEAYQDEINYEPSISELKKYLKHEKNPMRQQQLRRDIAKLERGSRGRK